MLTQIEKDNNKMLHVLEFPQIIGIYFSYFFFEDFNPLFFVFKGRQMKHANTSLKV